MVDLEGLTVVHYRNDDWPESDGSERLEGGDGSGVPLRQTPRGIIDQVLGGIVADMERVFDGVRSLVGLRRE